MNHGDLQHGELFSVQSSSERWFRNRRRIKQRRRSWRRTLEPHWLVRDMNTACVLLAHFDRSFT